MLALILRTHSIQHFLVLLLAMVLLTKPQVICGFMMVCYGITSARLPVPRDLQALQVQLALPALLALREQLVRPDQLVRQAFKVLPA
jgi:hypothetical protein